MQVDEDSAKVTFPPPFVYLGFLLIGMVIDRLMGGALPFSLLTRSVIATPLIALGIFLLMAAGGHFRRAGTEVKPWKTVSALVDDGVYSMTRNPMYLGMALLYTGLAIAFRSIGALLLLPAVILIIQTQVIAREERYMEEKFGDPYRAYKGARAALVVTGAMKGAQPWFAGEADGAAKRHAPATQRNRDAIAEVLRRELPEDGLVLEIASGSGEHAIYFAEQFPRHIWQPSDPDPVALASISAWIAEAALPNVLPPIELDASFPHWPVEQAEAILCINMIHISPWAATLGLLEEATRLLDKDAPLILYGPFLKSDIETAPSNLAFDQQLRSRDAAFGIRSVEDIDVAARERDLARMALYPMPANNMMLVYRRP